MALTCLDIEEAIAARLNSDTTLTGLVQAIGNVVVPDSVNVGQTRKPYIVWQVFGGQHDDAFQENTADVEVQITFRDHRANGIAPLRAVMARVYGDSKAQADMVPTYGLHRHKLTLTSDNIAGTMHRIRFDAAHEGNDMVEIHRYRVLLTEGT